MTSVAMTQLFKREGMTVHDAAERAGSIIGLSGRTVRGYRNDFFENKGELSDTKRGKYTRTTVYHDEKVCCALSIVVCKFILDFAID